MLSRTKRSVAVLVVLALVAAACTKTDADTTTTVVRNSPEAKAMIDAALGGTQAVQDFLIHLDMLVQAEDGHVSFYEELLERAVAGAGEPVDLAGELTFAPVDSLDGKMLDSGGSLLSSLSVDYGLLKPKQALYEVTAASVVQSLGADADPAILQSLDWVGGGPTGFLVEIITAHLAQLRTHVRPGDIASLDLSFLSEVKPGDNVASLHLFGQTYPGDPAMEAGLSPHDLFTYRWNQGLVGVYGTDGEPVVVALDLNAGDGSAEPSADNHGSLPPATGSSQGRVNGSGTVRLVGLVEGSRPNGPVNAANALDSDPLPSTLNQEVKSALVQAATGAGAAAGALLGTALIAEVYENALANPEGVGYGEVTVGSLFIGFNPATGVWGALQGPDAVFATEDPQMLIWFLMAYFAVEACLGTAHALIGANDALGRIQDVPPGLDNCLPPGDPPPLLPKPPGPLLGALLGDVHLRTFDRLAYSNQAAGEFLLFDNGTTTIQMRTEPVEGLDSVSVATALAVRIGELAVSLHAGGETWIDGELVQLTRGEAAAVGDVALLWWNGGWVVVWPDGTELEVRDSGSELVAFVTPSSAGNIGMLGNGDGDPANDLVSRSGDLFQVPPRPSGGYDDAFYDSFYSTYVDSWRITQEESLFHYGPGENTATFTIEGFPTRYARVSGLDPQTRADAEEACRIGGITREDLLEDCTLDVGFTGEKRFAYAHYLVQARTEPAVRVPDGAGPRDGDNIVTIGALSIDFGPDSALRDPSRTSRWECSWDEGQFRAFSAFAESPTRSFDVTVLYGSAETNPTGVQSFAVVVRLNSEDYAWTGITIDDVQPFTIDYLTLDGGTLTASGTAYLNDPPLPNAFPLVLPEGADLQRFTIQATCDQ